MSRLRKNFILLFFLALSATSSAQKTTHATISRAYLTGTWVIDHIDTETHHNSSPEITFTKDGGYFMQLRTVDKTEEKHKGVFILSADSIIHFQSGAEGVTDYKILSLSADRIRLKELHARDIIIFSRKR